MTNGDTPTYPLERSYDKTWVANGLTKREYFAAMAMQGMQSDNPSMGLRSSFLAKYAVEMADALITALNEEK
jgi:hypothetical protein